MTKRLELNIEQLIDQQPLGRLQIRVVGLCLLAMIVDGYDLFMIGLALPEIARDFGVSPSAVTGVIVAQSIGLAVGTYVAGPIADRYGRKWPLVFSVAAFGLLTMMTAQVADLTQFAIIRFFSGIFFAGVIPNAVPLTNETVPGKYRSGFVALIFCGYSGGTTISSFLNGYLLEAHGWQAVFVVGGVLGIILALPLALFLPESIRFRALRNPSDPRIVDALRQMNPSLHLTHGEFHLPEKAAGWSGGTSSIKALVERNRRPLTLLLWLIFSLSFIVTTTMAAWSATVLNRGHGLPISEVGILIGILSVGGLIGTGTSGFIMDRIGASKALLLFYGVSVLSMLFLAFADFRGWIAYVAMAFAGYFFTGAQGALNAYATNAYPTHIRATGVGWAFGCGRIGAIVGPVLGGQLIALGSSPAIFFTAMAAPLLLIVLLIPLMMSAQQRSH